MANNFIGVLEKWIYTNSIKILPKNGMYFQERNRKIMIEINLRQRERNSEVCI